MGNGIPYFINCCNKTDRTGKDIEINRINSKINSIKDFNSPTKETQKDNNFENLMKTDIKKNKYRKNEFITFKKRNFTQKYTNRSNLMNHQNIALFNNTFQILKNNQFISFANMNIIRNNSNFRNHSTNFNTLSGKLGNNSSSFYFSSGTNNKFDEAFKKIKLKLKLSGELFLNKKLTIDKYGLKHSKKKELNGITSFGISDHNNNLYDYIFDNNIIQKISKSNKYNKGKVFDILLDRNEKKYVLYYLHDSFLLYYKINNKLNLELDKDYFIILGNVFMTINIINSKKLKIYIEIKFESEKTKKYSFEMKDAPITIGKEDCSINIPKSSISKINSRIGYEKGSFWYKDENSKNASTLVIKEEDFLKIEGKMNFKLEDIPFVIEEINNNLKVNFNIHTISGKDDDEEDEIDEK
jgi:hypothetical protein